LRIDGEVSAILAAQYREAHGAVPSATQVRDALRALIGAADVERVDDPWPPEPEPSREGNCPPVDDFDDLPHEPGAELFDDVTRFIGRFVVCAPELRDAGALFVVHTHAFKAADCTPRFVLTSAEPQSGKTRFLEVFKL